MNLKGNTAEEALEQVKQIWDNVDIELKPTENEDEDEDQQDQNEIIYDELIKL